MYYSRNLPVPNVQELALKHPHELPERYVRSQEERPSLANLPSHLDIPIIDMERLLSEEHRQSETRKIGMAGEEWGFFQVVNHGISRSLTQRVKGVVRDFIKLPTEEKQEYRQDPWNEENPLYSLQGYGQAFVVSEEQRLDWADMLYIVTLPPENRNMHFWPRKPADFRETVNEYAVESQKLAEKLLSVLAEHLGLTPPNCFIPNFGEWMESMRINYYPPCPRPDLALGSSPHSDASSITILLQDDGVEGLQIRKDGQWIPVPPISDALVINVGDILEVMSNGRYKSIEHRAVANKDKDRISIATFYIPLDPEIEIGPVPGLIDELHPCLYRRFLRSEYEKTFFGNKLDGKKSLDFLKLRSSE